jgi:hypothetical protein
MARTGAGGAGKTALLGASLTAPAYRFVFTDAGFADAGFADAGLPRSGHHR